MIALVTLAEERLKRNRKAVFVTAQLPQAVAPLAAVAPILRGACSLKDAKIEGAWRRLILEFRTGPAILNFVNGADLARYSQAGVVTPDHTIRTKNWPLVVAAPEDGKTRRFQARRARGGGGLHRALPRLFRAPTMRASAAPRRRSIRCRASRWSPASACSASADRRRTQGSPPTSRECAVEVITDAEAIGRFESISEADMFDMEYWSLEQAKLGAAAEKPLAGQIAVITGAGGTIGAATAKAFAAAGAEVALLDLDEARRRRRRRKRSAARRLR